MMLRVKFKCDSPSMYLWAGDMEVALRTMLKSQWNPLCLRCCCEEFMHHSICCHVVVAHVAAGHYEVDWLQRGIRGPPVGRRPLAGGGGRYGQ